MKKKLLKLFISIFFIIFISISILGETLPTRNDIKKFNAPTTNLVDVRILGERMPYARWWNIDKILPNAHYFKVYDSKNKTYFYVYGKGNYYYTYKEDFKELERSRTTPYSEDFNFSIRRFDIDTSIEENRSYLGIPLFMLLKSGDIREASTIDEIKKILGDNYIKEIKVEIPTIDFNEVDKFYTVIDNKEQVLLLPVDNTITKGHIYEGESITYIDHKHDMELNIIGDYIVFRQIQYDTDYPYRMGSRDSSFISWIVIIEYVATALLWRAPISRFTYFDIALSTTLLLFPIIALFISKKKYRKLFIVWIVLNTIGQSLGTMFIIGMSR